MFKLISFIHFFTIPKTLKHIKISGFAQYCTFSKLETPRAIEGKVSKSKFKLNIKQNKYCNINHKSNTRITPKTPRMIAEHNSRDRLHWHTLATYLHTHKSNRIFFLGLLDDNTETKYLIQ